MEVLTRNLILPNTADMCLNAPTSHLHPDSDALRKGKGATSKTNVTCRVPVCSGSCTIVDTRRRLAERNSVCWHPDVPAGTVGPVNRTGKRFGQIALS